MSEFSVFVSVWIDSNWRWTKKKKEMNLFDNIKLRSFNWRKWMRYVINNIRKIINTREAEKRIQNKRIEKNWISAIWVRRVGKFTLFWLRVLMILIESSKQMIKKNWIRISKKRQESSSQSNSDLADSWRLVRHRKENDRESLRKEWLVTMKRDFLSI